MGAVQTKEEEWVQSRLRPARQSEGAVSLPAALQTPWKPQKTHHTGEDNSH